MGPALIAASFEVIEAEIVFELAILLFNRPGKAEVEYLDGAVLADLDGAGLEIAMHDPLLVCGGQRVSDLLRTTSASPTGSGPGFNLSANVGPSTSSKTRPNAGPVDPFSVLDP